MSFLPQGLCETKTLVDPTFPEMTGRKLLPLPQTKVQNFLTSIALLVKFPPSPPCIPLHPLSETRQHLFGYFLRVEKRTNHQQTTNKVFPQKQQGEGHRPTTKQEYGQAVLVSETKGNQKAFSHIQDPLSVDYGWEMKHLSGNRWKAP